MTDQYPQFSDPKIRDVYAGFSRPARDGMLKIRDLIIDAAKADSRIGEVSETLKWGQPSYIPRAPKTGTPIRLGVPKVGEFAIFVHCQTTVISEFRSLFPDDFTYDGNRAVIFSGVQEIVPSKVTLIIQRALTYRL